MIAHCQRCRTVNPPSSQFCVQCGLRLVASAPAAVPTPPTYIARPPAPVPPLASIAPHRRLNGWAILGLFAVIVAASYGIGDRTFYVLQITAVLGADSESSLLSLLFVARFGLAALIFLAIFWPRLHQNHIGIYIVAAIGAGAAIYGGMWFYIHVIVYSDWFSRLDWVLQEGALYGGLGAVGGLSASLILCLCMTRGRVGWVIFNTLSWAVIWASVEVATLAFIQYRLSHGSLYEYTNVSAQTIWILAGAQIAICALTILAWLLYRRTARLVQF